MSISFCFNFVLCFVTFTKKGNASTIFYIQLVSSTGKTSVDDVGYFLLVLKPLVQVKTQNVVVIIICFVMIGSNYFFETDAQQTPLLSSSLSS